MAEVFGRNVYDFYCFSSSVSCV